MARTSTAWLLHRNLLALLAIACPLLIGCAGKPQPPEPTFADAVSKIDTLTEQMLTAIEEGRPKEADGPLHKVGHSLNSLKQLAKDAGLAEEQLTQFDETVEQLLDGYQELHAPMHAKEFPEDFDATPVAEKLRAAMATLKGLAPALSGG